MFCILHKDTTYINPTKNKVSMGSPPPQNYPLNHKEDTLQQIILHGQTIHSGYTPWEALWHNKYLEGGYMIQCQDLTCSDGMKLPQCSMKLRFSFSDLCCEKWTISDPKNKSFNAKILSCLLSQYDFKWPGWSQVFTEANEIKGFQFLPAVLTHTASHLEIQGKAVFTF